MGGHGGSKVVLLLVGMRPILFAALIGHVIFVFVICNQFIITIGIS
jgi:hypothetical protein